MNRTRQKQIKLLVGDPTIKVGRKHGGRHRHLVKATGVGTYRNQRVTNKFLPTPMKFSVLPSAH